MTAEQQTRPKNWTEIYNSRNDKLREAMETAQSMIDIIGEEYEGVEVEKAGLISTSISFQLTEDEVENAPQEVRMVLDDLGITTEDKIQAQITLDTFYGDPRNFWFSLKPANITSKKLGLGLSRDGNNFIIAPTSITFDGVHKMVNTYVGKAASLHEVYVVGMGNKANPHLADILLPGVSWFKSVLDARQKPIVSETA